MFKIKWVFLGALLSFALLMPTFARAEYKLDFKVPTSVKLQLIENQEDASGYTRRYRVLSNKDNPNSINMLMVTHGSTVRFRPKEAMQEVLQVHRNANCRQKSSKVIKQLDNFIIFKTFLEQCSNGKSLDQIYKAFSTTNGQYAINYSAEPETVSQNTRQKMQELVKTARIVHSR